MNKFCNIPIFIPEAACPHQCVFCNQRKISGNYKIPAPAEIHSIINPYLKTISKDKIIEIAFFGGNFTGIPLDLQENYLKEAHSYIKSKQISGIRLSTRPDYITCEILDLLKKYEVKTIELGAQSTSDFVLKKSERGHTYKDIEQASNLILKYGFELGLQMMIGLPGDTKDMVLKTAKDIIKLGAKNTRIYPTLIIKGTKLEEMYNAGKYNPLSLDEAVRLTKTIYKLFEEHHVKVIRTGLHPSEELSFEKSLVAGPYHVSFKELVLTEIWYDLLTEELQNIHSGNITVETNNHQINYAVGYYGKNKKRLMKRFKTVQFKGDASLMKYEINVSRN